MSQVDWSKAPEGATHYSPRIEGLACPAFWREEGGKLVEFWGEYASGVLTNKKNHHGFAKSPSDCMSRPSSPAWSGEGLPPVGLVLEYMWNYKPEGSEYVRVEILAHDKGSAVMRVLDGPDPGVLRECRGGYCGPVRGQPIFRPIRTPEQIAAHERETAIEAMFLHWLNADSVKEFCGALYELGYRLPK